VSELNVIVLVGLTSFAAFLVGRRGLGLPGSALGDAVRAMLEAVGMGAIFLLANLVLAALILGLVRGAAGYFISVYAVDDLALGAASLLQGVVFRWWWGRR